MHDGYGPILLGLVVLFFLFLLVRLSDRESDKRRAKLNQAFWLGQRQGYFDGWLAHARGVPLDSMPPRLQEIENATETYQGGVGDKGFSDYPDTNELVQSGMMMTWEEWQARKLKKLNEQHLGAVKGPNGHGVTQPEETKA